MFSSGTCINIGLVDVFVLGSESLLLSGGVDVLGFLETLSGVSVNKLYNNALRRRMMVMVMMSTI